jgi:hypothetical protein
MAYELPLLAALETAPYRAVSGFDGGKGIWPEHLRAWNEWKNKNPKQEEKKRIITKETALSPVP